MRIRKKSWAEEELKTNKKIVKNPEQFKGKWQEYFHNQNPIYVEIGCGKGQFLSHNAIVNPDINYIGIERQETVVAVAARKMAENQGCLALIQADVEELSEIFSPGEIKRLFINFCDPWPKKKWAKRRLTHHNFLNSYRTLFGGGGEIFFKTDNQGLFEFSLNEFCADNWQLSNITLDLHKSDFLGNIMTEYEERFSKKGMPIYRLEARLKIEE